MVPLNDAPSEHSEAVSWFHAEIRSRLSACEDALRGSGIEANYITSPADFSGASPVRNLAVSYNGAPVGRLELRYAPGVASAAELAIRMMQSWLEELATAEREQALLQELSSSWEALETLYETSASLTLTQKPAILLDNLLSRAVMMQDDLQAAVWIETGGMAEPLAVKNHEPLEPMPVSGPLATSLAERSVIALNDAAQIAGADLPPHLRSARNIAVAPLLTREGLRGGVELWRCTPGKDFDTHLLRLLEALAHQAGLVLENERLNRAFIEGERVRRDIEIGSAIQQTLLFGSTPAPLPGVRVAAFSVPSQQIDGDFYELLRHENAALDVLVGDVMGKGVPAALLGAAAKSSFLRATAERDAHEELLDVASIARTVHRSLAPQLVLLETFVTFCYARFDLNRRMVDFIDCGHPRTIHYSSRSGTSAFLEGDGVPLGVTTKEMYDKRSVAFEPGDLFLFYSDGLTEACNEGGEFFGAERLCGLLERHAQAEPQEIIAAVRSAIVAFTGSDRFADDFTAVAVRMEDEMPVALVESEWRSDLDLVRPFREWVLSEVKRVCPELEDQPALWQIELAVDELFTNVVRHAYGQDPDRRIRIQLELYADRMILRLFHWGASFRSDQAPPPAFDGSRESGFGVYLIAQTMDSVEYRPNAHGCNEIVLIKKYSDVAETNNSNHEDRN